MRNIKAVDLLNSVFYRIPKWLMDLFIEKKISQGAFKTYILMYDRINLSAKNGWVDEEGDVYIKYSYDEMTEDLKCSRQSISNNLDDLERLDLIDKKKNFNSSTTFYLKIYSDDSSLENFTSKENLSSLENLTTASLENLDYCESRKLDANNNNFNNNNYSNNNNREIEKKIFELFQQKSIVEKDMFLKICIETGFKLETIIMFLEYMHHREYNGERMTTFSMKATINKLKNMSNGDESEIVKLISDSVGNGYKGIYKNKEKLNEKDKRNDERRGSESTYISGFERLKGG